MTENKENYRTEIHVMTEKFNSFEQRFDRFENRILSSIAKLYKQIETHYVTQDEFRVVRMITFGIAGTALTAVLVALLRQIIVN